MSKWTNFLICVVIVIVFFDNSLIFSSCISFSFSRNQGLEVGSVIIVDDAIGVVELEVVAGDRVEEVGLKEFIVLRSFETTVLPCSRSFLMSVII